MLRGEDKDPEEHPNIYKLGRGEGKGNVQGQWRSLRDYKGDSDESGLHMEGGGGEALRGE